VAIRTKKFQILGAIIKPIRVLMVDVQNEELAQPVALD
jgi:hypothetical protein